MPILVVSNPTIDRIAYRGSAFFEEKIGGPSYYVSLYAGNPVSEETRIVGAMRPQDIDKFYSEIPFPRTSNLEVVLEPTECTQLHYLLYTGRGERIVLTPKYCGLPSCRTLYRTLGKHKYWSVLFNPTIISGEDDLAALMMLKRYSVKLAVDLQSFVRRTSLFYKAFKILRNVEADILHANLEEALKLALFLNTDVKRIRELVKADSLVITDSSRKVVAYTRKGCVALKPPFDVHGRDSTGAGDVFIYSLLYYNGKEDFLDALKKATTLSTLHVTYINGLSRPPNKNAVLENYEKIREEVC